MLLRKRGCMRRLQTRVHCSVYLWVRSMGAKSSKWCHQANWGLIKSCWSAPIKLSTSFSFQALINAVWVRHERNILLVVSKRPDVTVMVTDGIAKLILIMTKLIVDKNTQVSCLGNATEAKCILPACRGAVFMQECWVGKHTAVYQRTVSLA